MKLLGFRFYAEGYERATEDNYFILLLPEGKEIGYDGIKDPSKLELNELSTCDIFENNLKPGDCFNILQQLFIKDLYGKGTYDIHGSSIKTLAFFKILLEISSKKILGNYGSILNNNAMNELPEYINHISKGRLILKPLNTEKHATVLLLCKENEECYYLLFDSSLVHFNEKERLFGNHAEKIKLLCNTGEKCFQSSGCCTYYSMCFMKVITKAINEIIDKIIGNSDDKNKEPKIKEIIEEIQKQEEKLQLDVIVEMSNIFDKEENKTLIKINNETEEKDKESQYIIINVDGAKYGLNRDAYLGNFLELGGIRNFKKYIGKEEDKKLFENMIQFQNMLLGKAFSIVDDNVAETEKEAHKKLYSYGEEYINISYNNDNSEELKNNFNNFKDGKEIDNVIENIKNFIKKKQKDSVITTTDSIGNLPKHTYDTYKNKQQDLLNMRLASTELSEKEKKEEEIKIVYNK